MITGWSTQTSRIDKNTEVLMIRLSKCSMALACPDDDKEAGDSYMKLLLGRGFCVGMMVYKTNKKNQTLWCYYNGSDITF